LTSTDLLLITAVSTGVVTTTAETTISTTAEATVSTTAFTFGLGGSSLDADATAIQLLVIPLGDGSINVTLADGNESETTAATSLAILQDNGVLDLELRESRAKGIISSSPGETSNKKLGHIFNLNVYAN